MLIDRAFAKLSARVLGSGVKIIRSDQTIGVQKGELMLSIKLSDDDECDEQAIDLLVKVAWKGSV